MIPRVGVIIPARDALSTIETCLTTVRRQTYLNVSTYIVDDASTDGTFEFLHDRPTWYHGFLRHPESRGWPASLNRAARMALDDGCELLFPLMADDFLRLDCLERCEETIRRSPWLDWVNPLPQQIGGLNIAQRSTPGLTAASYPGTHTPMVAYALIRAGLWKRLDGYAEDVSLPDLRAGFQEMDFYYRALVGGAKYATHGEDPGATVYYRVHPGQLSHTVVARTAECLALIHAKHPELGERA